MPVKNYQPNNGGVQFNIENLHVNDLIVDIRLSQKNPNLTLLIQEEDFEEQNNPLVQIVKRYFDKNAQKREFW